MARRGFRHVLVVTDEDAHRGDLGARPLRAAAPVDAGPAQGHRPRRERRRARLRGPRGARAGHRDARAGRGGRAAHAVRVGPQRRGDRARHRARDAGPRRGGHRLLLDGPGQRGPRRADARHRPGQRDHLPRPRGRGPPGHARAAPRLRRRGEPHARRLRLPALQGQHHGAQPRLVPERCRVARALRRLDPQLRPGGAAQRLDLLRLPRAARRRHARRPAARVPARQREGPAGVPAPDGGQRGADPARRWASSATSSAGRGARST